MSLQRAAGAVKDVLPNFTDKIPSKLTDYTENLYMKSNSKLGGVLKPTEEIARYHICAYIAVEKLADRLSLPEPSTDKIPIPPKNLARLVNDFRNGLSNLSPVKGNSSPFKGTEPLTPTRKRTKQILATPSSSKKLKLDASPAMSPMTPRRRGRPPKNATLENVSPFKSPAKSPVKSPGRPRKYSPLKTDVKSPSKKAQLSPAQIIAFCKKFHLPDEVITNILKSFNFYYGKISNQWCLLCGLVNMAYNVINTSELDSKIGARSKFFNDLHHFQNGGIVKQELHFWLKLVDDILAGEKWIQDLQTEHKDSQTSKPIHSFGNMTQQDSIFDSGAKAWKAYDSWAAKIQNELSLIT